MQFSARISLPPPASMSLRAKFCEVDLCDCACRPVVKAIDDGHQGKMVARIDWDLRKQMFELS